MLEIWGTKCQVLYLTSVYSLSKDAQVTIIERAAMDV